MVDIPGQSTQEKPVQFTEKQLKQTFETAPELAGGFYGSATSPGIGSSPILTQYTPPKKEEYSNSRIARAAFERENTIVSGLANSINGTEFDNLEDPNFDSVDYTQSLIDTEYAPYYEKFLGIKNEADAEKLKRKIDREKLNDEMLTNSEIKGFAFSLAAAVLDPVNLIPIGGGAYKSFRAGKLVKGALETAAAGGVSVGISESILQSQQETRTLEESAVNIAGGTVLSGILGGGAALLSKQKFNKLSKQLEKDLHEEPRFDLSPTGDLTSRSVGAAQVTSDLEKYYKDVFVKEAEAKGINPISFRDFENQMQQPTEMLFEPSILKARESLAQIPAVGKVTERTAKDLAKITRLNPSRRILASQSLEAKKIMEKLVNTSLGLKKNVLGIESIQSAENNAKRWRAGFYGEAKPEVYKLYNQYSKRFKESGAEPEFKSIGKFEEAVGMALRRKDYHPTLEVQKAAELLRSKVIDPLKVGAQEIGFLADDETLKKSVEKTALSYFPRKWNQQLVIAYEDDLSKILSDKLKNVEIPKIREKFAIDESALVNQIDRLKLEKADVAKIKNLESKLADMRYEFNSKFKEIEIETSIKQEEALIKAVGIENYNKYYKVNKDKDYYIDRYIEEVVDSIILNLKGETRHGFVDAGFKISKRGPLKERVLDFVTDKEVERFLDSNATKVLENYTNLMSKDIEISRLFNGDVTLKNEIKKIDDEYAKLAARKTPLERKALNKEKIRVKKDIEGMRDVLRGLPLTGTFGYINPDTIISRTFRATRLYQYVTKMGAVVEASLADIAQPIAIHGMKRWSKGISQLITNLEGIKLNVKEAKLAGNILERISPGRMATMSELNDPLTTRESKFEKLLSNMSNVMSKINLMPIWNDSMKAFSSVLTQQRMIEEINNLLSGSIKQKDKEYLAFLGIGPDQADAINAQLEKFAKKEGGLWVANTDKWTDTQASNIYRNALNLDVDRTIVSPGVGDIPLFMQTELGKTIFQFKSFTIASTQQVLIARLQQKDMAALTGLISATSLGMLTYYLRAKSQNKELSKDPKKWIVEGVDRSGYLGIIMEYNNIAERLTGGTVGINALTDSEVMSRYASRNITSTLIGPSAGSIEDTAKIIYAISTGEIEESDVKAFRRMLPYQNNYFIRGAADEMEESLNSILGTNDSK